MALAFVQATSTKNDATGTSISASALSVTTGNLIVVAVRSSSNQGTSVTSVTDTAGNAYTQIDTQNAPVFNSPLTLFYAKNITGHASNVVTANFSGSVDYRGISVQEISGADTTAPLDVSAKGSATNTSASTGSFTTTVVDTIVVCGMTPESVGQSYTPGSGYTIPTGATSDYITSQYQIFSSIQSSVTASFSTGASNGKAIIAAAFKAAASGHAPLTANQGSYTYTGQTVGLLAKRTIPLVQGSYTLTGQTANLYKGFYLLAAQGSYTLTGQTTSLLAVRLLALAQGSYTLTGQNVNLLRGFPLTAVQGSYNLSGQETGLIYSGAVAPLSANSGSYTLTGQTVNFRYNRIVGLAQGSYSLTGQTANALYGRRLVSAQGSYSLTGQTVNLAKGFYTPLSPGTYTLTGNAVSFLVRRLLALAQGTYTLTGQSVSFVVPSEDSHALYGSLRWSPLRYETMLIGNDNTLWLTGVRDATAPTNADGTPDFIDDCAVTWNIKDAAYPNGSIQGQGTAVAVGSGGEYVIQVDDDILEVLTQNEHYWLNVTFTQPITGFVGFISARFLVRVRTGRTVGT